MSQDTLAEITFVWTFINWLTINRIGTRVRQMEEWLGYRKPETGREKIRRRLLG